MTETTISFNSSGQALFSAEEVHRLMRVEFERAMRYEYSVACVLVQVDRIQALETMHGFDAKMEMLRMVVETMKKEIRCSDSWGAWSTTACSRSSRTRPVRTRSASRSASCAA